jgi:hypothetical protein
VTIRLPWRQGPINYVTGPVVISATKFTYKRLRDLPAVAVAALRLRRGWQRRPGAFGLLVGAELERYLGELAKHNPPTDRRVLDAWERMLATGPSARMV